MVFFTVNQKYMKAASTWSKKKKFKDPCLIFSGKMLEAQVKGKEIVVCPVSERGHNLLIHWLKQSSILRKNSLSLVSTKSLLRHGHEIKELNQMKSVRMKTSKKCQRIPTRRQSIPHIFLFANDVFPNRCTICLFRSYFRLNFPSCTIW